MHEVLHFLCVLRWLLRLILLVALNYLLQIEHERSEEESSVGVAFALAFRWARFCSASLIFQQYPYLWGLVTLVDPVQSFPRFCWNVEVSKGGFEGVFVSILLTTTGAFSHL